MVLKRIVAAMTFGLVLANSAVFAHGNVTPQKVDTTGLDPIGTEWVSANPYYGNALAVKIGMNAFAQNCAMCHGMGAVSGGIAPDLRKTFNDLVENPEEAEGKYKNSEGDDLFKTRMLNGAVRNGVVYMPKMAEKVSQEGLWTIWTFISTLCSPDQVDDKSFGCQAVGETKLTVKPNLVKYYEGVK